MDSCLLASHNQSLYCMPLIGCLCNQLPVSICSFYRNVSPPATLFVFRIFVASMAYPSFVKGIKLGIPEWRLRRVKPWQGVWATSEDWSIDVWPAHAGGVATWSLETSTTVERTRNLRTFTEYFDCGDVSQRLSLVVISSTNVHTTVCHLHVSNHQVSC